MEKIIVKAVIFDFDGTLVDTEDVHIAAWEIAGQKLGVAADFDYGVGIGVTDKAFADMIAKQFGLDSKTLFDEKFKIFLDYKNAQFKVYDGVFETIEKLHNLSIPMAIASNSLTDYLETIAISVGIDKYIGCRLGTYLEDNTVKGKPEPDLYLNALKELGVDPKNAIAVEDSPLGIEAAKSAGIYTFGITNNFDEDKLSHSDKVIKNIDEIFNYIDF